MTEHNLIVTNGVRVLTACWEAGSAAAAECPVDRSPARALHPRHVLPGCEGHVSQFTHPSFQSFIEATSAELVWGDQCAVGWKPFPSAPLPPMKTTQWLVTPSLVCRARELLGSLRCDVSNHDHSGGLVGQTSSGRFHTSGTEQYSPWLCRRISDVLWSHLEFWNNPRLDDLDLGRAYLHP